MYFSHSSPPYTLKQCPSPTAAGAQAAHLHLIRVLLPCDKDIGQERWGSVSLRHLNTSDISGTGQGLKAKLPRKGT